MLELKLCTPVEIICQNIPDQFSVVLNYAKSLEFEDEPDYQFLKSLFAELAEEHQLDQDGPEYDWAERSLFDSLRNDQAQLNAIEQKTDMNIKFLVETMLDSVNGDSKPKVSD